MRYLLIVVVGVACTVPPPFYGLETPSTLPSGHVLVMGGVGCGFNSAGCYAGAGGRLRLGIGHHQEVGADAQAFADGMPGFKLAYKVALSERIALGAGLGATYHCDTAKHAAVGGDLGVVALLGRVRADAPLFAALRVSAAVPVWNPDIYKGGGVVEMVTIPIGVSWPITPHWRVLGEAGPVAAVVTSRTIGHRTNLDDSIKTGTSFGFYGGAAVAWTP